jgi:hypothetical protein
MPGYGGAFPPPPPSSNGKTALIIGLVVLVVVGLGLAGWLVLKGDSSSSNTAGGGTSQASGSGSDEDQIRNIFSKTNGVSGPQDLMCANDLKLAGRFGGNLPGGAGTAGGAGRPDISANVSNIQVDGDTATATVSGTIGSRQLPSGQMYFRKESGKWKMCMTDSPMLKNMPGMN